MWPLGVFFVAVDSVESHSSFGCIWRNLCILYLLACQVRITVSDSVLGVHLTSFDCGLDYFCLLIVVVLVPLRVDTITFWIIQ